MEPFIPIELVHDSLLFLTRNELEKCQLVCQRWKDIVTANGNHMALRKLSNLAIWEVDEDAIALASEPKYPSISWQALKQLHVISGSKINIFRYGCTNEPYELIPEILNYTTIQKITINEQQNIRKILTDPVKIPVPPRKIVMLVDNTVLGNEDLLDFIGKRNLYGAERYSLKFLTSMSWRHGFFPELMRIYTRAEEPKKLVHSLKFTINERGEKISGEMPHTQFLHWLNLNENKITPILKFEEKFRKEIYELKRRPGYVIKVIIIKNFEDKILGVKLKVDDLKERVSYKSLKMEPIQENRVNEDVGDEHWNPAWCSIL